MPRAAPSVRASAGARATGASPRRPPAAWSFDYSVNTGVGGSTKTLADYNFTITISDGTTTQIYDLQHNTATSTLDAAKPGTTTPAKAPAKPATPPKPKK